ncbi:hypothetical protein B0A49_11362, partial [Cryomyces minteri]
MASEAANPEDTSSQSLPERPKDAPAGEAPSKNALKKAAKEKEKAEKAAKRKAAEDAQKQQSAAEDVSAKDYGKLPMVGSEAYTPSGVTRVTLSTMAEQFKDASSAEGEGGPEVVFRAVVDNARVQSAKLAFLMFKQGLDTIQAVVAASETLSRQMVKFAGTIPAESLVIVHGVVKKPFEP